MKNRKWVLLVALMVGVTIFSGCEKKAPPPAPAKGPCESGGRALAPGEGTCVDRCPGRFACNYCCANSAGGPACTAACTAQYTCAEPATPNCLATTTTAMLPAQCFGQCAPAALLSDTTEILVNQAGLGEEITGFLYWLDPLQRSHVTTLLEAITPSSWQLIEQLLVEPRGGLASYNSELNRYLTAWGWDGSDPANRYHVYLVWIDQYLSNVPYSLYRKFAFREYSLEVAGKVLEPR